MERFGCYNLNGSQTGIGTLTPLPDGRFEVRASFGSPFAGSVCDDGPTYQAIVDTREQALAWLRHHRMEV